MDSLGMSIPNILGATRVEQRSAGNNKQGAEAFRRALQQETGDGTEQERDAVEEPPVRTRLQPGSSPSRRDGQVGSRHVDVIA